MMTFPEELKSALDESGMSARAAAAELGIPENTFYSWTTGKRTPPKFTQDSVLHAVKEMRKQK